MHFQQLWCEYAQFSESTVAIRAYDVSQNHNFIQKCVGRIGYARRDLFFDAGAFGIHSFR